MKKIIVALAMALFASTSYAAVAGSAHDFNASTTYDTDKSSRCVYCHVPHNAETWAGTALWATQQPTLANFDWYSAQDYVVLEANVDERESLTCLACHADSAQANADLLNDISGTKNLGFDLTNDHPVGALWNSVTSPSHSLKAFPITIGRDTITSETYIQCATCHAVHGTSTYTIQTRAMLYGPGNSGVAGTGHPADTEFCGICHSR